MHDPWLVAARQLTWKKEPWLEANYFGVMMALGQIVRNEGESREARYEAELLIDKLNSTGKAPPCVAPQKRLARGRPMSSPE